VSFCQKKKEQRKIASVTAEVNPVIYLFVELSWYLIFL